YAPRAPLEISQDGSRRVRELITKGHKVGWLTRAIAAADALELDNIVRTEMPADPEGYSSRLYYALHALDNSRVSRIVVDALPLTDDWLALRDRLQRASSEEV